MFRASTAFDKILEKATSNLLLETDWASILQICDLIRQGDCQAKYALSAIKKKIYNANPHVSIFALQVLESCVKNCGHLMHDEIATKAFMEEMKELLKTTTHENIRQKLLELIQAWSHAFRNSPKYRAVQDTLNIIKAEGYKFPTLKESDAMFSADTAPAWEDGDCCHRCRVKFGVVQRQHHCRACGQVFCGKCSSKSAALPKFGIEKEVRVCDTCFDKFSKLPTSVKPETDSTPERSTSPVSQPAIASSSPASACGSNANSNSTSSKEDEELKLALAISKWEAEQKNKGGSSGSGAIIQEREKATEREKERTISPILKSKTDDSVDPELARYLNRDYWEQRSHSQSGLESSDRIAKQSTDKEIEQHRRHTISGSPVQPSAPPSQNIVNNSVAASQMIATSTNAVATEQYQNGETDMTDDFVMALKGQLEVFVNRMKSNSSRGRSLALDSTVQALFMNVTNMHAELLHHIHQLDDKRVYYESLQDKLNQIKDARAALEALRDEYREKQMREAEEAERQRHLQMAQKLEIMRKKKQEYLQYQRQLALQRMQEQERELQLRQEQQKHQYISHHHQIATGYNMPIQGPQHSFSPAGQQIAAPYQQPGGLMQMSNNTPMHLPHQQPYQQQSVVGGQNYGVSGVPDNTAISAQLSNNLMPHQIHQQLPHQILPGGGGGGGMMGQIPVGQQTQPQMQQLQGGHHPQQMAQQLPPTGYQQNDSGQMPQNSFESNSAAIQQNISNAMAAAGPIMGSAPPATPPTTGELISFD